MILRYPKKQSVAFSNALFRLYDQAKRAQTPKITFDLSRTESLTPFGIIMLTATIRESFRNGKECLYQKPIDRDLQRFFRKVGFHKHFGIKDEMFEEKDILHSGNVQLKRATGLDTMLIETLTEILDYHLSISRGVKESLRLSLIEAITNVIDHSEIDDYYICCQHYPERRQIRLCIADSGIGIRNSLSKSAEYTNLRNDHNAIERATEEGVTSRPGRAGLGLNHIKQFLTVNKGQLCIISGHGKVFWKFDQGKTLRQCMPIEFTGTILKIIVNVDKDSFYFMSDETEYLF